MKELRVSLLQLNVVPNDPAANAAKVRGMLDGIPRGNMPDIFVLPEFWTTPFIPAAAEGPVPVSCDGSEEALRTVCETCGELGVFSLAGSLPWPVPGGAAVRSWLVDDGGTPVDYYDKTHLFSPSGESRAFTAGSRPLFFDLGGVKCSAMTCYDVYFPEFGKSLALCGAEVLFVNAAWSAAREGFWEPLLRALAMHNQFYVAACNATGRSGDLDFFGRSMLVSPWGDILAEAGGEEGPLTVRLPLSEVYKCRKYIPLSRDRCPDLYPAF